MKTTKNTLKKAALALALILAGSTISFAQCDKPVTFKSSVTNYLDEKGEVERSKDEETVVTISKTEVTLTPGDHAMTGAVKNYVCNWATPFKTGKTSFSTVLDDNGREMHANFVIEGKDGKIILTFTADEMPGKKIQVTADSFQ